MDSMASFLLASFALVGSPGPNTVSLAALGAAFGARKVLSYMVGLNLGMVGVVILIGSGFWVTILSIPRIAPVVTVAATAYLTLLAYKIATAPALGTGVTMPTHPPRWHAGMALSLSNPKAYFAVAAVLSRYSLWPTNNALDQFAKALLLLATIVFVNILWLAVGSKLATRIRSAAVGRFVNLCFATALVISVLVASFL
ncbi:LysE family translocator [Chelativorans alearense]|uniref:LysE family translocator n=1 Tax=Chelativorans alearense TaxID=2681495 RepID=UPI0013D541E5|nr:LysE family transporter [Chelativorans alearense]